MNGDPIRDPLHRFSPQTSASFGNYSSFGSSSIPLLKCAIDFPGHNRMYSLHSSPSLPIPRPPILGLRSFAAQSPHTNEIAGWAIKPKCVVIPVRIQSGDIHAIKRTYRAYTHAVKRTCLYN
jgi:hypothetical protein